MIPCHHELAHREPDVVAIDKEQKRCLVINIACPADNKAGHEEKGKGERMRSKETVAV